MQRVLLKVRTRSYLLRNLSNVSAEMTSELALKKGQPCPPLEPGTLRMYSMRFCPYAQRTRLVLIYKGIKHETVNVNLRYKPQWLFDMNPTGLVPILQWDNHVIYESATCNDYLDEMYPQNKLNPTDPYQRARDRQLWESMGKLIDSFYAIGDTMGKDQKIMDRLFRAYTRYERELIARGGGPYFGRSKPCMVDFMIWPWFERLPVVNAMVPETKITTSNYPKLAAWIDTMYRLPAVKQTMFGDLDLCQSWFISLNPNRNLALSISFRGLMIVTATELIFSPTADHCFDDDHVGKQPVAWKENCANYW